MSFRAIRDEEPAAHDDGQTGVADFISVTAVEAIPKWLERLAPHELPYLFAGHILSPCVIAGDYKQATIAAAVGNTTKEKLSDHTKSASSRAYARRSDRPPLAVVEGIEGRRKEGRFHRTEPRPLGSG